MNLIQRLSLTSYFLVSALGANFSLAQAPGASPPTPPSFGAMFNEMLPMFAMVFFIFYFMVIRPQNRKLLDQRKLIDSLKKGDPVVTSSGIIGKVFAVEKDSVALEVSSNVRLKFEPSHIAKRVQAVENEAKS